MSTKQTWDVNSWTIADEQIFKTLTIISAENKKDAKVFLHNMTLLENRRSTNSMENYRTMSQCYSIIKVLCEQTRKLTHDFLDYGLGNFVVDCHIQSTSISSMFADVAKTQSKLG